ncbi:hypothetical protein Ahy_B08g090222 [Arachis hypogaea]|uniref:Ubiquitin-like protease family profile domain-containing protein n=1 Tax=Arachis hypogaea TaxID=3818 RepID=A0A444XZR0_ARAHY|nr:hypothetical protein Ahy_B08g090222 [Arachis hypogaea]
MERHLHALYSNGCTSRKPLLNGALFHFSKPFKENTTVPFSSNIRKRRYTTRVTVFVVLVLLQTRDLKYATHLLNEKFRNMSEEKKTIVRDLGFGGLMHIPPLRVHHQLLRELANNFKLRENRLETGYGSFKIRPKTIGDALGINASGDLFPQKVNYKDLSEDDKEIFRRFQGKTLKSLTDEMMDIGVGNEQDRLMFKRIFILYIQMAFLLPTTINKISPVHLTPIFEMDTITERNWGGHVLSFIIKGITDYKEKKKKAIDGCLFALMIIYFHLSKNKDKKRAERPPKPWIANWSKEQLVKRMRAEIEENMVSDHNITQSKKKKVVVEHSSLEQDQSYHGYRKTNENSAAQGEKEADLRSMEGHYVSSETILDVNLGSDDPSSQGHTEQSSVNKPVESMLSLIEESASEPANSNMMVVREETPSEGLAIVSIQVCLPVSQTTTVPEFEETPETEYEPTPLLQIEGTIKTTPEPPPPQQLEESTPTLPLAPSKINPAPEDAAALMMMARTASYVPKTDPIPSFSLGFTDSSQEETTTQEGAFQEEVYCLPPDIVNMALSNHPDGVFLQPKNNKPFRVEDYLMFIPFLDLQKLKSHRYIFAPVCHSFHWWAWIVDTRKRKFYIVDPLHNKSPSKERIVLNTFVLGVYLFNIRSNYKLLWVYPFIEIIHGYVISQIKKIVAPYLHISGQKTRYKSFTLKIKLSYIYDCAIYVMKWLKIFEPANIKRRKYEWDNWTQDEVNHFRVEYASRILFHDMNLDKNEAIRGSNAIRLSKLSSLLLSSYCQIDSQDVDTT